MSEGGQNNLSNPNIGKKSRGTVERYSKMAMKNISLYV